MITLLALLLASDTVSPARPWVGCKRARTLMDDAWAKYESLEKLKNGNPATVTQKPPEPPKTDLPPTRVDEPPVVVKDPPKITDAPPTRTENPPVTKKDPPVVTPPVVTPPIKRKPVRCATH